MIESLDSLLEQGHGVATTAQLRTAGYSKKQVAAAVAAKRLERVIRGRFIAPGSQLTDVGVARLAGGSLTGPSALPHHKLWTPHGSALTRHFRLTKKGAELWERSAAGRRFGRAGDCIHVLYDTESNRFDDLIDGPVPALLALAKCGGLDDVIAAIESFARGGGDLEELRRLPQKPRRFAEALDLATTTADSGLESLARVRLQRLGIDVRAQVTCAGWPCDLVIGEWLVVELDGFEFHSSRAALDRDLRKDRELVLAGYTILRFSYNDVMRNWPACVEQILAVVAAGWHARSRAS
ncbi:MAG: DUF559 domain-containing protein [Microbacteriaceae bacterium]|nr:DUF559 domain-containing protein [Microbacteriaceae bacterium]